LSEVAARAGDRTRSLLVWVVVAIAICVPIAAAAASPLLAWRQPVYIIAGFAGIAAMALLLLQPLLGSRSAAGTDALGARASSIAGSVRRSVRPRGASRRRALGDQPARCDRCAHVFVADTIFRMGRDRHVGAVWRCASLAGFRHRLRPRLWRRVHTALALVIVAGSIVHALLIDGTMETVSKVALCALVLVATLKAVAGARAWTLKRR
jgi:hypothetical protein